MIRKCRSVSFLLASLASGCSSIGHHDDRNSDNEFNAPQSEAVATVETAVDVKQWQEVPKFTSTGESRENLYSEPSDKNPEVMRVLEELDNVYYTDRSNYKGLFDTYENVVRHDVIFANDSMNLGTAGKARVRAILPDYDPETDIVSLIGCSSGKTSIKNGNKVLALERVRRLQQELTDLGVEEAKIFSEGCWAPVHFDDFPRRGVVVSILRKQK